MFLVCVARFSARKNPTLTRDLSELVEAVFRFLANKKLELSFGIELGQNLKFIRARDSSGNSENLDD